MGSDNGMGSDSEGPADGGADATTEDGGADGGADSDEANQI